MDPVVDLTLRAALALLLGAAAAHKLGDLPRFRATLSEYRLLPAAAVGLGSVVVPGLELALGSALLLRGARAVGLAGSAALLSGYALAIAINLVRGRAELDCGCLAGRGRRTISWWLVARNGALVLAALGALAPVAARPLGWIDALTVAGALGTATLAWMATDGLLANLDGVARVRGTA